MLTHLTRYQVSQVLNEALKEAGRDPVPSQRLYNKSTKIRTERVGDQDLVPVPEAVRFVKAFVARQQQATANLDEIMDLIREDS
jgi:hypothetical protein